MTLANFPRKLLAGAALPLLLGWLLLPVAVSAQDDVIYPSNSPDSHYADLDQLPDLRGLWFPAFAFGSGPAEEPMPKPHLS